MSASDFTIRCGFCPTQIPLEDMAFTCETCGAHQRAPLFVALVCADCGCSQHFMDCPGCRTRFDATAPLTARVDGEGNPLPPRVHLHYPPKFEIAISELTVEQALGDEERALAAPGLPALRRSVFAFPFPQEALSGLRVHTAHLAGETLWLHGKVLQPEGDAQDAAFAQVSFRLPPGADRAECVDYSIAHPPAQSEAVRRRTGIHRLTDLMAADEISINDDLQRAARRPLTMDAARRLFQRSQDVVFTATAPVRSAVAVSGEGDWPRALRAGLNLYSVPLDDLRSSTAPVGRLELSWSASKGPALTASAGAGALERVHHAPPPGATAPAGAPAGAPAAVAAQPPPKRGKLIAGIALGAALLIVGGAATWRSEQAAESEAASAPVPAARPALDDLSPYVSEVRASCPTLPSNSGDDTYGTNNLLDGDLTTSWQESVAGDGEGQWLEVHFDKPVNVLRVEIAGGYQQHQSEYGDLYRLNGRPSGVRVSLDGMDGSETSLTDQPTWQPLNASLSGVCVMRLTLTGVYPGERWQDTAISELRIEGRLTGETFFRAGGNRAVSFKNRGCPHQL